MVNNLERYVGENIVRVTEDFLDFDQISKIKISGGKLVRNADYSWVLTRPLRQSDLKDEVFMEYLASGWKNDKQFIQFLKSSERLL